jgi:hypothetical protein
VIWAALRPKSPKFPNYLFTFEPNGGGEDI